MSRFSHVTISKFRRFREDARGVSAIEFAMIAPLFIVLFFGTIEISQAVGADRKANLLSRTLADLVSQFSTVSNSEMNNIFNAATAVMAPYNAGTDHLKSIVSAVNIDGNGVAKIVWSDTKTGDNSSTSSSKCTDYSKDQIVTNKIPAALRVVNTQLIWSEITYTYKSPVSYFILPAGKQLKNQNFMRPRETATVVRTPVCP